MRIGIETSQQEDFLVVIDCFIRHEIATTFLCMCINNIEVKVVRPVERVNISLRA